MRDHDAAQRADAGAVGGSLHADRSPQPDVSRRLQEREAGTHRLCAPVRAPDAWARRTSSPRRTRRWSPRSAARAMPTRPTMRRCLGNRAGADLPMILWLEADRTATLRIDKTRSPTSGRRQGKRRACASTTSRSWPAERDHLRPGVHGASLQARDDRSMADLEAASADDARFYQTYMPSNATPRPGRRLRFDAGDSAGEQLHGARAEIGPRRAARHPAGAAADQGEARHAAAAVAASGRRRRLSHHLRRQSGFVSAAHRRQGALRRPELAHLQEAGLRIADGGRGVRPGEPDRGSQPLLCGGDRPAGEQDRGRRQHADRGDGEAEGHADHRSRAAAHQEPVRARLHSPARIEPVEGRCAGARRGFTATSDRRRRVQRSSRARPPPTQRAADLFCGESSRADADAVGRRGPSSRRLGDRPSAIVGCRSSCASRRPPRRRRRGSGRPSGRRRRWRRATSSFRPTNCRRCPTACRWSRCCITSSRS